MKTRKQFAGESYDSSRIDDDVIQRIGPPAKSLIPAIKQAGIKSAQHKDVASYIGRQVGYLPEKLAN